MHFQLYIIQVRWKMLILLGKFIQDTIYQIISESAEFYETYDKNCHVFPIHNTGI